MAFDIKDPKTQKMLATFLIPVVVLYAFFNFVIQPKINELNELKTEVNNLRVRLNKMSAGLGTKEKLNMEKAQMLEKISELEMLLPEEENVASLLDQFSMVEKDTKVYVVGFNATESVESEDKPYRANNYNITIEAGYHQFSNFVGRVLALPRLLSFSDMRISVNPMVETVGGFDESLADQPRHLTIECTLTSYVFKDFAEESGS
ncbi:type 4a pilus biogenesis protein PilO [Candidatus Latescibacterota bacterium]